MSGTLSLHKLAKCPTSRQKKIQQTNKKKKENKQTKKNTKGFGLRSKLGTQLMRAPNSGNHAISALDSQPTHHPGVEERAKERRHYPDEHHLKCSKVWTLYQSEYSAGSGPSMHWTRYFTV